MSDTFTNDNDFIAAGEAAAQETANLQAWVEDDGKIAQQKYILIENPGVAAPEAFTLLGASNKAGTEAIGQFGSGTKHSTLVCLRREIPPTVFCGNLKLSFGTKQIDFDGARKDQVVVKVTGKDRNNKQVNRTEDLSVVVQYGQIDWKDKVELALREFVSNALDATQGDASQIRVEIVDSPRAKAGFTRVYVPLTDDGRTFVENIGEWFLQFSGRVWRDSCLIHKNTPSKAKIYRRGVLVRTCEQSPDSLYDYNLNDLPLDEARIASDYSVKHFASKAVRDCNDAGVIGRVFAKSANTWEGTFDLEGTYDYTATAADKIKQAATWKKAVETVLPADTIILSATESASFAEGKGYKVVRVNDAVYAAAKKHGLRTTDTILTQDERNGRKVDAVAGQHAVQAVCLVWSHLSSIEVTNGEKFPQVKTFSEVGSSGEASTHGYYRDGTVFINNKLVSGETVSDELYATVLEELAHYITKATDNSRDFQNWFITVCVKLFRTK